MDANYDKNVSVENMWKEYIRHIGEEPESTCKKYTSWHFCNDKKSSDNLVELVKTGKKNATASAVRSYEFEGEELPEIGNLSIVTNWDGEAQFIIRTSKIDIVPFRDVSEEFAAVEGEGDGSLEYWRKVHTEYFSEEFEEMGEEFTEDALTICERFEIVFPLEFVR